MSETAADLRLTGQFLIALPSLADGLFARSVTFLCEHDENGALGIIINHPLNITLSTVYQQLGFDADDDTPVLAGGPVSSERGFVLHDDDSETWQSSLSVSPELTLSSSKDILEAMAAGGGPQQRLVALGYAGWAPGQLEQEIQSNAWLTVDADSHILFQTPAKDRYARALAKLGVSPEQLSSEAGHA